MKNRIIEYLSDYKTTDCGDYIEIKLPVMLDFDFKLLSLRIYPISKTEGYYVSDDGRAFAEMHNDTAEFYFKKFDNDDKNDHFDITVKNGYFQKKFRPDYSVIAAINDFIRFFVYFDDYMTYKNPDIEALLDEDCEDL